MDKRSAVAAVRFGLGRRPSDPLPSDPVVWLDRQIGSVAPLRQVAGAPPPLTYRQALDLNNDATERVTDARRDAEAKRQLLVRAEADAIAWTAQCLVSDAPFQDRLTNFWGNHFTISRRVRNASVFIGPHLRETVRRHQFGKFSDMLVETARNPGMITYLSNGRSMGPNSPVGRRTQRGLNENLAREILELHTLSPASGYTQADVTEFARALTGWSTDRSDGGQGFGFRRALHEPGTKTIMGKTFPEGEEGGVEALRWLGEHPATHRHLATKLVQHFVNDMPPPAAVERLFGVLRDTRGDLGATCRELVRLPAAWEPPLSKVRSPFDYVIAVGRAIEATGAQAEALHQAMGTLGQPLWSAAQPVGWSDTAEEWVVPEAVLHRIEWAHTMAGRAGRRDIRALVDATLGPLASPDLLRETARAGSPQDALTIAFVSPEFQRR